MSRRGLLGLLVLGGCTYFHDSDLLPQPDQPLDAQALARLPFPVRRLDVTAAGRPIATYYVPAPGSGPLLVAFGGNGNDAGRMLQVVAPRARALGFGVIVASYNVQGEPPPTVAQLRAAARAVYDAAAAIRPDITLLGHSLGCWIAIDLATRVPAKALILAAVGTNVADTFGRQYAPLDWIVDYRSDPDVAQLDAVRDAARITAPTLIVTSNADTTIPPSLTRRVYAALPAATRKQLVVFEGIPHGSYLARPAFWAAVHQFLSTP